MKLVKLIAIILLGILLYHGCDTTEPPPTPPKPEIKDTVTINVYDATHRSITLHVKTTAHHQNRMVELYRSLNQNDTLAASFPLTVKDTTIIDDNNGDGLTIDTEYGYFAVTLDSTNTPQDTTGKLTAKTLAPASHDYDWEEFTIGEWQSSLSDVWGTDENNVYAVGGVKINDTTYGVLKWDGTEWLPEKKKGGLRAIIGFGENDIWAVGGNVYHYDGEKWSPKAFAIDENGSVITLDQVLKENLSYTSLWGTSSENLYLGSHWGKILHWDGEEGEVVYEPNQDRRIEHIDGLGEDFIIAVGSRLTGGSLAVIYDGTTWSEYSTVDMDEFLEAVTIINQHEIFFSGTFIYSIKNDKWRKEDYNNDFYMYDIEYNHKSGEIVACGDGDGVVVYNGVSWKKYNISNDGSIYWGLHTFEKTKIIVGGSDTQAKILIGKRN